MWWLFIVGLIFFVIVFSVFWVKTFGDNEYVEDKDETIKSVLDSSK